MTRPAVPLAEAFRFWLKLGFVSFGGPAGQIAIMHQELVEKRRWISEGRFLHALNYCMLLPGPEAQQLATYLGWLMHRTRGGIVAGALFVLPSLAILIGLTWIYLAFGDVPAVGGILYGIKPAVTAIVALAAWRLGARTLKNAWTISIATAAFVALFAFSVPFPLIVLAAGIAGWVGGRIAPEKFIAGGHGPAGDKHGDAQAVTPALINEDTPTPEHARFSRGRFLTVLGTGLIIWATAIGALAIISPGTFTDMALFFTRAALVTFGGAYAVLPYVVQNAVDGYGWLTATQMIDGLALGETTPGPLIMVVAFVGFVGGWSGEVLGPESLALAGAAGACVATFFTFLPSFVFILAGGPFVESTHGRLGFTAPLAGITAAVVGVILNLAIFFAWHVLWPNGWDTRPGAGPAGGFDWASALIGIAAFVAMQRFKAGVIPVILGCGAAGLVLRLAF